MAFMMSIEWDGVSTEGYDAVRRLVNWEGDRPAGGIFHMCAVGENGLLITDVWETPEHFQAFVNTRLMPGVQQVGLTSEPKVRIFPVHAVYNPDANPA